MTSHSIAGVKMPGEQTEELRIDRLGELEPLRQKIARWAADNYDSLKLAKPQIPQKITNARARDNWRVLLAIADVAGGYWPDKARRVALLFASEEPDTQSSKILLLHDLKAIFTEKDAERLESEEIVRLLVEIEGRPWAEGRNGKPLSKTGLARMLKPFKIHPDKWREGNSTIRGYLRSAFDEVFARYLDIEPPQTPRASQSTTYEKKEPPQPDSSVAFGNKTNSNEMTAVASVAFANSGDDEFSSDGVHSGFEQRNVEGL
jgi:Protein of unknown function (DUF3631)